MHACTLVCMHYVRSLHHCVQLTQIQSKFLCASMRMNSPYVGLVAQHSGTATIKNFDAGLRVQSADDDIDTCPMRSASALAPGDKQQIRQTPISEWFVVPQIQMFNQSSARLISSRFSCKPDLQHQTQRTKFLCCCCCCWRSYGPGSRWCPRRLPRC